MERLSSCIRCVKGTPSGRPFWGYIFVRNVQSLLTAWGGIIFAGIITYEALRVTDCLPPDDTRACSRKSSDDEEDDTPNCRRLWGLVAPEALLTVIATAGAVVLALCSAFVGNYMDSTPYRRQIAMCGTCLVAIFTFICAAIVAPSEEVLLLCSVSLFILSCLKEILNMTIESYAPELSSISTEVAAAITSANLWYYVTMTAWLLVFAIVGTGLSSSTFGFASALITGTFIIIFAFGAFSRLPNVPAAHLPPNDLSVVEASLIQLKSLAKRTYKDYPDLGLVLVAIMFFDPALQAVFTVAIQVLIGAYHFTSQDIPIIFLCAVVVSVPGIAFSKFVTSTTLWEYIEKTDLVPSDLPIESVTVETEFGSSLEIIESIPTPVMRHPGRILICLRGGLITVISVTIMAPFILQPCNIGLAILVGCMWSFCLCFNWNCSSMLRAALVPGGSEAEFAGLTIVSFSILSWLPLLIFLVMANAGFLIEAMWSLCAFYVLGIVVLSFVDADRGAAARDKTLHLRRWVRNKTVRNIDNRNAATELASNERVQNVETEIPTNIELNTRCDESESVL